MKTGTSAYKMGYYYSEKALSGNSSLIPNKDFPWPREDEELSIDEKIEFLFGMNNAIIKQILKQPPYRS